MVLRTCRHTHEALRNSWSRICPRLSGKAYEPVAPMPDRAIGAAIMPQAHPPAGRHQRYFHDRSNSVTTEIGPCANDLTATMLIILLSADNGTIGNTQPTARVHGFARAAGSAAHRRLAVIRGRLFMQSSREFYTVGEGIRSCRIRSPGRSLRAISPLRTGNCLSTGRPSARATLRRLQPDC